MVSDLQFGDFHRVDVLTEQWRRYSTFHQDLHLELVNTHSFESVSLCGSVSHTIRAMERITLTTTQDTTQHVFLHLEQHQRLKKKLIGKRVAYSVLVEFAFDARHKVQRLDFALDFVASLLDVLHKARDASTVLEQALIVRDSYLCDSDTTSTSLMVCR